MGGKQQEMFYVELVLKCKYKYKSYRSYLYSKHQKRNLIDILEQFVTNYK